MNNSNLTNANIANVWTVNTSKLRIPVGDINTDSKNISWADKPAAWALPPRRSLFHYSQRVPNPMHMPTAAPAAAAAAPVVAAPSTIRKPRKRSRTHKQNQKRRSQRRRVASKHS